MTKHERGWLNIWPFRKKEPKTPSPEVTIKALQELQATLPDAAAELRNFKIVSKAEKKVKELSSLIRKHLPEIEEYRRQLVTIVAELRQFVNRKEKDEAIRNKIAEAQPILYAKNGLETKLAVNFSINFPDTLLPKLKETKGWGELKNLADGAHIELQINKDTNTVVGIEVVPDTFVHDVKEFLLPSKQIDSEEREMVEHFGT